MKISIKDFFLECDQIHSILRESLMENFIFCTVCLRPFEKNKALKHSKYGGKQAGTVQKPCLFCTKLQVGVSMKL